MNVNVQSWIDTHYDNFSRDYYNVNMLSTCADYFGSKDLYSALMQCGLRRGLR
jgi:hypothetical protein